MELLIDFFQNTGFGMADYRHLVMISVGLVFIYLGIAKHYEPLLLVPIGFGILVGFSSPTAHTGCSMLHNCPCQ